MSAENQRYVQLDANQSSVHDLTVYGFKTTLLKEGSVGDQLNGQLLLDNEAIDIQFRIRQQMGDECACTFFDLGLTDREAIERYVRSKAHMSVADDTLDGRSYDDLAKGLHSADDSRPNQKTAAPAKAPPNRQLMKTAATFGMMMALAAMLILVVMFLRSRSSLGVDNSALVGNYLPVHARVEGEIIEVLVKEGQDVARGDVLLRLDNPEIRAEKALSESGVHLGEAKVAALNKKLNNYLANVEVAKKRLAIHLEVAKSDTESSKKQYESAQVTVNRTKPHLGTAISNAEYDVLLNDMLAMKAKYEANASRIQLAEFAHEMSSSSVLMLGDSLDDEVGSITADLEIAQAELALSRRTLEIATQREKQLDVVAPRDGRVYATYRQFGEYLRVADEVIAISYPGETWAAGLVTAAQASRVRPGLPVTVTIPSLNRKLKGVVSAVGHRAMYGKGGYSADFRGTTATDVPVKVLIADLPKNISSGMRLEMKINTGFGVEWIDRMTGFELQPINGIEPETGRNVHALNDPSSEPSDERPTEPSVDVSDRSVKVTSFRIGD